VPKALPTSREIASWRPAHLSQIENCDDAVRFLSEHLDSEGQGPNILIAGDPGTGKSTLAHAYIRALVCQRRCGSPPRHCGECPTCSSFDAQHRDIGLFSTLRLRSEGCEEIHYFPVNCGATTEAELRTIFEDDRREFQGRFVIALQEAQFLKARSLDKGLLTILEDDGLDILWIADTAYPQKLDPMFLRRFARITTGPHDEQRLAEYLAGKCSEWRIEVDAPETLALLSERSKGIVAECVRVLSLAALNKERILSRATVAKYSFIVPESPYAK
jgi:hypothetical protein